MEKNILIDGREVPFKATAATIRIYRQTFQRDILNDMERLQKEASDGRMTAEALEMFENMAYVMARQADPTIPSTADEWFDIYQILPEIVALWGVSTTTLSESKKKALRQTGL